MVTVDEIAIDCQKDIAVLLAATISEDSRVKDFLRGRDIQQMQERYDQWAGNLGALQQLGSPLSLEYRLRDAPLIRESILNTLENLHISMQAGKRLNIRIFDQLTSVSHRHHYRQTPEQGWRPLKYRF